MLIRQPDIQPAEPRHPQPPTTPARPRRRLSALLRKLCGPQDDGQSLIEFALTLPIFMLVITGVLYFGVVLFDYLMLTEATQVATRQLMISRGQTLDPCQTLVNALYTAAPNLQRTSLTISVSLNNVTYSSTSCPGTATSGAPANMVLGTNAVVTATYPAKLALLGDLISSGFLLSAQETEQIQ
jgi:Flp pilus assembly protein TadG